MRMPADFLKIDRTLLDFVTTRDGSLVNAVAELGRTLGLAPLHQERLAPGPAGARR